MRLNSILAQELQLSASQQGVCSMDFISKVRLIAITISLEAVCSQLHSLICYVLKHDIRPYAPPTESTKLDSLLHLQKA